MCGKELPAPVVELAVETLDVLDPEEVAAVPQTFD